MRGAQKHRVKVMPNGPRRRKLDIAHLRKLAEFRFQLRRFLHVSQAATERVGLHNQQYQLLQCVGGMPDGVVPTIANVAKRMVLKHNSTVELVDRTIVQGLLSRVSDEADHRRILLRMTPQGERILAELAEFHMRELEQSGPELVRALDGIVQATSHAARRAAKSATSRAKQRWKAAAR